MNARQLAQANPSSGASNSSDFQPPTGNPQTVPGEIFPSSPSLQNQTSEELLQNGQATINVPDGPDGPASRTTGAKTGSGLFLLVLAILFGALILGSLLRRRRRPSIQPLEAELQELQVAANVPINTAATPQTKPVSKKKKSKKRSGQNKRRK